LEEQIQTRKDLRANLDRKKPLEFSPSHLEKESFRDWRPQCLDVSRAIAGKHDLAGDLEDTMDGGPPSSTCARVGPE
jgi:hypothetical protein